MSAPTPRLRREAEFIRLVDDGEWKNLEEYFVNTTTETTPWWRRRVSRSPDVEGGSSILRTTTVLTLESAREALICAVRQTFSTCSLRVLEELLDAEDDFLADEEEDEEADDDDDSDYENDDDDADREPDDQEEEYDDIDTDSNDDEDEEKSKRTIDSKDDEADEQVDDDDDNEDDEDDEEELPPPKVYPRSTTSTILEMALVNHRGCNDAVIELIVRRRPSLLWQSARVDSGSHLHLACSCRTSVASFLLDKNPEAAQVVNDRGELPIHILCNQHRDITALDLELIRRLYDAHPLGFLHRRRGAEQALPLGLACNRAGTTELVVQLLQLCPRAAQSSHPTYGGLCLHDAAFRSDRVDIGVFRALLQACPQSARRRERGMQRGGYLPLHTACSVHGASSDVIRLLLEFFPQAAQMRTVTKLTTAARGGGHDDLGYLPLHLLCRGVWPSPGALRSLLEAYPDAARQRANGRLPIHMMFHFESGRSSLEAIRVVLQWYPQGLLLSCQERPEDDDDNDRPKDFPAPPPKVTCFQLAKRRVNPFSPQQLIEAAFPTKDSVPTSTCNDETQTSPSPLIIACANGVPSDALQVLAERYPDSARWNYQGRLPLHVLCEESIGPHQLTHDRVAVLVRAFGGAVSVESVDGCAPEASGPRDTQIQFSSGVRGYPFATASMNNGDLSSLYYLLRAYPEVLKHITEPKSERE